jgi:NAD(P)-dependent dehydrogenase (short-subunit alcohol dehydrogenase family)
MDDKDVDPRKFSVMQRIQRFAKEEKYDDAEMDTGKKKIMSIFITGSTGTLGNEFVEKLTVMKEKETRKTINIYPGYRTESKLKPIHFKHRPIRLDLGNPEMSIAAVPEEYVIPAQEVVLINNAGISLPTVDPKILQQCLMTNVLFPLKFIGDLISYDNQKRDVTIINISSGDGERCYLDPDISQQIASCKNFDELDEVMAELVEGVFDYDKEYARGPTPMYSLSKAFLNQGTILFDEMIHARNLAPRYKIFAVCPGNFPSPMSTAEELACSEHRVSVSDAVDGIMPLIFERQFYSSGKFYRFGQEIPW